MSHRRSCTELQRSLETTASINNSSTIGRSPSAVVKLFQSEIHAATIERFALRKRPKPLDTHWDRMSNRDGRQFDAGMMPLKFGSEASLDVPRLAASFPHERLAKLG
jgi:hypothetical protein